MWGGGVCVAATRPRVYCVLWVRERFFVLVVIGVVVVLLLYCILDCWCAGVFIIVLNNIIITDT